MPNIQTHLQGFGFQARSGRLELLEKPLRPLATSEVLLENEAIGLNPVDYKLLEYFGDEQSSQILGVDGVGRVIESTSAHIKKGERYAYHANLHFDGSFSTHIYLPARALLRLDATLQERDIFQAAALPCPGLTAMQCIRKLPSLKGQDVLIVGAGGSVGRILSALCVGAYANVWGVCSKKHHIDLLDSGVKHCLEYADIDGSGKLPKELAGRFHAVFDCMGWREKLLPLLGFCGHFIGVVGRLEQNPSPAFERCLSLHEVALGAIHTYGSEADFKQLQAQWQALLNALRVGEQKMWHRILPRLELVSFEQIPAALSRLQHENLGVKIVAKAQSKPR